MRSSLKTLHPRRISATNSSPVNKRIVGKSRPLLLLRRFWGKEARCCSFWQHAARKKRTRNEVISAQELTKLRLWHSVLLCSNPVGPITVVSQPRSQGFSLEGGPAPPTFKGKALGTRLSSKQHTPRSKQCYYEVKHSQNCYVRASEGCTIRNKGNGKIATHTKQQEHNGE